MLRENKICKGMLANSGTAVVASFGEDRDDDEVTAVENVT